MTCVTMLKIALNMAAPINIKLTDGKSTVALETCWLMYRCIGPCDLANTRMRKTEEGVRMQS